MYTIPEKRLTFRQLMTYQRASYIPLFSQFIRQYLPASTRKCIPDDQFVHRLVIATVFTELVGKIYYEVSYDVFIEIGEYHRTPRMIKNCEANYEFVNGRILYVEGYDHTVHPSLACDTFYAETKQYNIHSDIEKQKLLCEMCDDYDPTQKRL